MKKPIFRFKRTPPLAENEIWHVKAEVMGRKELLAEVIRLNNQVLALQAELTIEHEKTNAVVRMLSCIYDGLFHITSSYINALRTYKESGNDKPIPAMFIAARVCEVFETTFEKHPVIAHGLGPDKTLLRNIYHTAHRGLDRKTNMGQYLFGVAKEDNGDAQEDKN